MTDARYIVGVIAAMALITLALRALPFIAAQWLQKNTIVERLGEFLPLAIMTLLLLHSAAGSAQQDRLGPWPELLAVVMVIVLQWRSRNALLSIVLGTTAYVVMRNLTPG
ncbi:MAG: AzlD protein [Proteobacteria bacterium]|nr:AzlD protein [Pseudomonadota bacterium]